MGDRRNVVVNFGDTSVALYTHWNGIELPGTLAKALDRGRDRWGDATYLTRIIFNEMTRGSEFDNTGFGIEPFLTDTGVYCEAWPEGDLFVIPGHDYIWFEGGVYSFEEFITDYLPTENVTTATVELTGSGKRTKVTRRTTRVTVESY